MEGYTAKLTVPGHVTPPIESFEQLKDNPQIKILVRGLGQEFYQKEVLKNKDFGTEAINATILMLNTLDDLVVYKMMQDHPETYVYIYSPSYLRYIAEFSKPGYRGFYESEESLMGVYSSLNYLKSFPYKEFFNRKITLLHAMDFINTISDIKFVNNYTSLDDEDNI